MTCLYFFQVQRIGVKVLKDKRVLQQVKNKGEVACVVLNSLCELDHVNDFIVYAKDIGRHISTLFTLGL